MMVLLYHVITISRRPKKWKTLTTHSRNNKIWKKIKYDVGGRVTEGKPREETMNKKEKNSNDQNVHTSYYYLLSMHMVVLVI